MECFLAKRIDVSRRILYLVKQTKSRDDENKLAVLYHDSECVQVISSTGQTRSYQGALLSKKNVSFDPEFQYVIYLVYEAVSNVTSNLQSYKALIELSQIIIQKQLESKNRNSYPLINLTLEHYYTRVTDLAGEFKHVSKVLAVQPGGKIFIAFDKWALQGRRLPNVYTYINHGSSVVPVTIYDVYKDSTKDNAATLDICHGRVENSKCSRFYIDKQCLCKRVPVNNCVKFGDIYLNWTEINSKHIATYPLLQIGPTKIYPLDFQLAKLTPEFVVYLAASCKTWEYCLDIRRVV